MLLSRQGPHLSMAHRILIVEDNPIDQRLFEQALSDPSREIEICNDGREALAAFERKEIGMIFPTVKHLERIAPYHTVAELMVFAAAKRIATVEPEYSDGELALPAEVVDAW